MSTTTKPFIGAWRNYSNGVLTLTLNERDAGILSAALIIFTGFVASQAWSIAKFILHQSRVAGHVRDGYYHQQQAALRNSNSHTQALWLALRLALGWRRPLGFSNAFWRSSIILAVSLISLVGWSVAQLFVSRIWTAAGNEVLIANNVCGTLYPNLSLTAESAQIWNVYYKDRLESASTYERQCYSQPLDSLECTQLPVPRLNWTTDDAACPFVDTGLCIKTNSTPVKMDSGYINSNTHLGVNAKLEDTIEYRKVATCSPIQPNHVVLISANDTRDDVFQYHYGYNFALNSEQTFNYSVNYLSPIDGYRIMTYFYDPANKKPGWRPNSTTFDRSDAGISIFFLTMDLLTYFEPVYDMWFLTNPEPSDNYTYKGQPVSIYLPFQPVTILACVEEHELCNPTLSGSARCSRFTPAVDNDALFTTLQFKPSQNATATRLGVSMLPTDLSNIAFMLSQPILASKTILSGGQYGKIPKDQWRAEVGRWFSISLNVIQTGLVEFVTGPSNAGLRQYVTEISGADAAADCKRQRIRNVASVRNFNVVAVVIVVTLGLVIIAVGLSIDTVVGWVENRLKCGYKRRLSWIIDGIFQQQRLVLQAAGIGGWSDTDTDIPTTVEQSFPPATLERFSLDSNCVYSG